MELTLAAGAEAEKLRSVRGSDREDLQLLLRRAEQGQLSRAETAALFMYVRGDAPQGSMLKDIGHTVAHDERTRGFAYDYVNDFADRIVAHFDGRGDLDVGVLFPIEHLVVELATFAHSIGLNLDAQALMNKRMRMAARIGSLLDGTSIKIKRRAEITCEFALYADAPPVVTMDVSAPVGKVIQWRPGATLAFPLLIGLW